MMDLLFNPNSIAVIGASQDPQKVGHAILNNLLRFGFESKIYPINPSAKEILGLRAYPTVSEVGEDIDLAIPAASVNDVLIQCGDAGLKTAVIISTGLKESGPGGQDFRGLPKG